MRGALALLALGFVAFLSLTTGNAATAQTPPTDYHVEIGKFIKGAPAESMAFYPSSLKVHSGDVIRFTNESGDIPETGIHGVLALPAEQAPREWELENARNLDGEWAFFQTDPDDDAGRSPTALKGNWRMLFPSDLTCGTTDNPCVTGTSPASRSPLNSGVGDPLDFSFKIEAEPGTRIWLICPIHTTMKMKVEVVPDDQPTTTVEQIKTRNATKLARETARADRLDKRFRTIQRSELRHDGTRLWHAWPGLERGTLSLYKMYPSRLSIATGDSVKWHFEEGRFEIHSVSFPLAAALDVNNAPWITLACDLDTDQGTAPDVDPQGGVCPSPPSDAWEFDLHRRFYFKHGNQNLRGDEYESSGMRGPLAGMPFKPFTMRFPQSSGLGVFDYACQLHPTMRGRVKVH